MDDDNKKVNKKTNKESNKRTSSVTGREFEYPTIKKFDFDILDIIDPKVDTSIPIGIRKPKEYDIPKYIKKPESHTEKLLEGILKQDSYKDYTKEDFLKLMDKISMVETKDSNIKQKTNNGEGPGRGYYQLEPNSLETNLKRLQNYEKELGINVGLKYDSINYDNLMEQNKDIQRVIALAGILKEARKRNTYIDPTNPMKTWLNYHWIGNPKNRATEYPKRVKHWENTFK